MGGVLLSFGAFSIPRILPAQEAQQFSPLTLQQAVNMALEKNPERKAALADTKAASADVREARSSLLPHVTFQRRLRGATILSTSSEASCGSSGSRRLISR
jgi:outer membrane protein TolC